MTTETIQITGDNVSITPALRTLVNNKLKHLEKFQSFITRIQIILSTDHLNQIAEAQIGVKKSIIHAKASSHDMHQAIDDMVDKLNAQLAKYKDKLVTHRE